MNYDQALHQREEGMAKAEFSVGENWCNTAYEFIVNYCKQNSELFCDDLWAAGLSKPKSMRALGPVIKKAARAGIISPTGMWRKSIYSNLSVKPVWRVN